MAQAVPAMMWPIGQADAGGGQRPGAAHQGDQQEDQFAGVHVAEQPHAVRHGLGDEFDHLHGEVERPQQRVGAERRGEQLVDPAAQALDLDVVEQADQQHRHRQAHGHRQVGRGHDAQVGVVRVMAGGAVDPLPDRREQVDRQQVHRVQHEDPDEHRERQRGDELAALGVVHDALGLASRPSRPGSRPRPGSGPGTPEVALRAASHSSQQTRTPSAMEKNSESKLKTEKSTTLLALWFCRCVRW